MAVRLGKTEDVLRKELSGAATHKMGVITACQISSFCMQAQSENCNAFATSVASASGGFIRLEVRDMAGKQDIRTSLSDLIKESSDVLHQATVALADERISDNEMKAIDREIREVIALSQAVLAMAQSRNLASKPVELRSAA